MSDPMELFRVQFDRLIEEIKRGICFEVDTKANALFALLQEELRRQLSTDDQVNMVVTGDDPNESDEIVFCRFQADEADTVSVKSECDCDTSQDEDYDIKEEPEEEEDRGEADDGDDNENNQDEADDNVSRENAEDNVDADSESSYDQDDEDYSFEGLESDSASVKSESDSECECDYDSEQDDDIEVKEKLIDADQEGTEERENPTGTDQVVSIASTSSGFCRSTRKSVKRKNISPDDTATSDDEDSDRGRYEAEGQRKSARVNSSPAVRTEANHEDTSGNGDTKQVITRYLNCTVTGCVEQCKDKVKLKEHLKSKHGVYLDRCLVRGCNATFPNRYQIGDHLGSAHSTLTSWPCNICTVQCRSYHILTIHVWQNHEQGHFACGYTGCIFTSHISRMKVMNHQYHHKPATHQCTFTGCGKAFKTSRDLKNHLVTHTGEKPFRCVTCDTAFTHKSSLTVHLKSQTHQRNAELTAAN